MVKEFHTHLNPKLWDKNNRLHSEVSGKLKQIANAFIEFMGINEDAIKDVVITGSSASYNYTPHSDIDLHVLVDVEKVHKDCPIVNEFLLSKKSEFNNKHDIYIYGIPVEVYAEDYRNENVHNGLYSLKKNEWIDKPQKLKPVDNDIAVQVKYKELASAAKEVADKDEAEKLIDKIKKMRKAGLADGGEFSVENLVFKKLRNEGIIDKLMQTKKEGIDRELSLEEGLDVVYENLIDSVILLLEGGISVGKWSTANANSIEGRKAKAEETKRAYDNLNINTSRNARDYVKADRKYTKNGSLRKNLSRNDIDYDAFNKALKAVEDAKKKVFIADKKLAHSQELEKLNLPKNSAISAKKLTDAARNSVEGRFDTNNRNREKDEPGCCATSSKREARARNIKFADPNWDRKNKKEREDYLKNYSGKSQKESSTATSSPSMSKSDLEDMYKRVLPKTGQAKTEHENAQILQGLRNKLEKIYNKNEALGSLCESLLDVLEEINTGISGMMDVQPTPLAGQRQPSYTKQEKKKEKPAMYRYLYRKTRSNG